MYKQVEPYSKGQAIEVILPKSFDNFNFDIGPIKTLLECLRYAGLISDKTSDENKDLGHRVFLIHPPKSSGNKATWIEMNCQRIRSFGWEAYPVRFV